ncbi:MAG: flagellar protein FlgN [Phycisphaeraceae bacterium]|nr:MAG: flagellar protein FlgN [Phycisphaeraceae bacterium]
MHDDASKSQHASEWSMTLDRLERLLVEQVATQRRLLEALDRKREAIARADAAALERLSREEQQLLARHGALDQEREALVATLGGAYGNEPSAGGGAHNRGSPVVLRSIHPTQHSALSTGNFNPLSLTDIAHREGGARGERLIALRDQARANVAELKRRSGILAQAAAALSAHLTGIMQAVGAAAMGGINAGTYGRQGRLAGIGSGAGVVSLSAVDLTT